MLLKPSVELFSSVIVFFGSKFLFGCFFIFPFFLLGFSFHSYIVVQILLNCLSMFFSDHLWTNYFEFFVRNSLDLHFLRLVIVFFW